MGGSFHGLEIAYFKYIGKNLKAGIIMAKKQNEFALEFEKPIKDLNDKIEEMKVSNHRDLNSRSKELKWAICTRK